MKKIYKLTLICLGTATIYFSVFSEYLLLRYVILLAGISALGLGLFFEHKFWKTNPTALIVLGGSIIYPALLTENLLLRYLILSTGVSNLVIGFFLEYKQWKTYPPQIRNVVLLYCIVMIPMMILVWYLAVIRGVRIFS